MRFIRNFFCRLGYHKRLQVIQSFGSAQHIGCPDCHREYGIHHGMQACVPWDPDLAQLYVDSGYDVETPRRVWRQRLQKAA